MRRIGAVFLEGLLLRAHLEHPSEEALPIIIVDADRGRDGGPTVALTPAAATEGIRLGQSRVQALARCGKLRVLELDPARVRALQDRLLHTLTRVSPILEDGLAVEVEPDQGVGLVRFDAAGLGLLHPTEADLLRFVEATLQEAFAPAPPFGVALAGGPAIAGILACAHRSLGSGARLVGPGRDRAALASLPLDRLHAPEQAGLPPDALEHLWLLSVRTIGGFAALPPTTVETRFGPDGLALHRLARGDDPRPLHPWEPAPPEHLTESLSRPAGALPELEAALAPLIETLTQRLARQGRSLAALEIRYVPERNRRAPDGHAQGGPLRRGSTPAVGRSPEAPDPFLRTIGLLDPLASPQAILGLVHLDLVARPLPCAITRLELRVARSVQRPRGQSDLFDHAPPRGDLARAVARLRGRLGEQSVGVPVLVDRHRPEAGYTLDPSLTRADHLVAAEPPAGQAASLALRMLPQPRPVSVETGSEGRPARIDGRPATSAGPFPLSGEWWADPYDRRYFEVETEEAVLWVYSDGANGRWYVHGIFD